MGDPRRLRRKYVGPAHPWQKETLDIEKALKQEYAFKNKTELWKMTSLLKRFKNRAKKLIAARGAQAVKEQGQLMQRLQKLGLIQEDAKLDSILSLQTKDVLERRLQSLVYRKGLARSMKQARQFITHYHITINGKKITSPGYIVAKADESMIQFAQRSTLINPEHPERAPVQRKVELKKEKAPEAAQ